MTILFLSLFNFLSVFLYDSSYALFFVMKMDFTMPRGVGEKYLLRQVSSLLGCVSAAKLPKRAIQFGSRIAKLSETSRGREDGSSACKRLVVQNL